MKILTIHLCTMLFVLVASVACRSQPTNASAASQALDKKAQAIADKYNIHLEASEPTGKGARSEKDSTTLVVKSREEFEAVMKRVGMMRQRGEALDKNTQAMLDELAGVTDQEKRKAISDKYELIQEEILKKYP